MKFTVMVSQQGTACAETALCSEHDNDERRAEAERATKRFPRQDRGVRWEYGVENDALRCTVCGVGDRNEFLE